MASPSTSKIWELTCDGLVDTVLDDCFQLISLFFLTIGRNQEAPAVYVVTVRTTITLLADMFANQLLRSLHSKGPPPP